MSPEEKQLLEKAVALGQENNAILRGIRRSSRWAFIGKVLYWFLIIALSYGAYIKIQPYVDKTLKVYSGLQGTASSVQKSASQLSGLDKLLDYLSK